MKNKISAYRRLSQLLRLPLAGPLFRLYAPRRRWLQKTSHPSRHQILIVNLMPSLGDTICYMAMAEVLRAQVPDAEITWLAHPAMSRLIESHPAVDRVLTLSTPSSSLTNLRTFGSYFRVFHMILGIRRLPLDEPFDIALLPRGGVDPSFSAHAVWMLNVPITAGYSRLVEPADTDHSFSDSLLTSLQTRLVVLHEAARSIHLLSRTGLVPDAIRHFDPLQPLSGLVRIANAVESKPILRRLGIPDGSSFIVIAPFAGHPRREWPPENFRELARKIVANTDSYIILSGTITQFGACEAIGSDLGERVINSSGKLDLLELISIIFSGAAFVGNDSGAGHVAGALGKPTISLHVYPQGADPFQKSSPEKCKPLGPFVTMVQPEHFLTPCESRCESQTAHCIAQITVEQVWRCLESSLAQTADLGERVVHAE